MTRRAPKTGTVLDRILAVKAYVVARQKTDTPLADLKSRIADLPPAANFSGALRRPGVALIAEMKRASPSGGELQLDLDPRRQAAVYCSAGAAAISVLTEEKYFLGSLEDLRIVKGVAGGRGLPVLQKDFIFDEYQVYEARACGADAVLLIVAVLERSKVRDLRELAADLGLGVLVESHDESELEIAVESGAEVLGINNRNLRTLETSLEVFERLAPQVPADRVLVAESGMKGVDAVGRVARAGANAVLVGESLMRAGAGVGELARQLAAIEIGSSSPRKPRHPEVSPLTPPPREGGGTGVEALR
ncbi:MAG: indole-3-glycerol phosphate synthase TrpC [Chloroflexi bacterium]|nr:indole-3-glycerol phosphate synthase TrpC [Chloroflexota bacterium]